MTYIPQGVLDSLSVSSMDVNGKRDDSHTRLISDRYFCGVGWGYLIAGAHIEGCYGGKGACYVMFEVLETERSRNLGKRMSIRLLLMGRY